MLTASESSLAQASPQLEIVAPDELALKASSADASIWLRNPTDAPILPRLSASLEDHDGAAVSEAAAQVVVIDDADAEIAPDSVPPVPARSVSRYRVLLEGSAIEDGVSGELIASADGLVSGVTTLSVAARADYDVDSNLVLGIPLLLAVVIMALAWTGAGRPSAKAPLGALDLDFTKSFASTLTAVGALLGTIVAAGVLPDDTQHLTSDAYVALNLVFGVAIVVAALIYASVQRATWDDLPDTRPKQQTRKQQGFVWVFVISCVITVWAVLGELLTLAILVDELGGDSGFTTVAVWGFRGMLLVSAFAVLFYVVWRFDSIVNSTRIKPDTGEEVAPPQELVVPRITLL
jgi:hypothetical protein